MKLLDEEGAGAAAAWPPAAAPSSVTGEARPPQAAAGLGARVLDALLTREPPMRIRLGMCVLVFSLMLCGTVALYLTAVAGLASWRGVHAWAVVSFGLNLLSYGLIRSGISRRWRDPSLTLFQCIAAMACVAAAYVIAEPARGVILPMLAVILMFGIFGLTPRQMVAVLAYGLVLFGLTLGFVHVRQPPGEQSLALAGAYLIVIALVLVSSTFLIWRAHGVREKLRQQKAQLARAVEQVRELATHDDLTGLPNRRFMLEMLRVELLRAQRSARPLLVAQLDLDFFKAINDTHGHAAGDAALRAFAREVSTCVRSSDLLARWGGEEFVLLMAGTSAADGQQLLARVLSTANMQVPLPGGACAHLTVSIGATCAQAGDSVDALLHRADAALYEAKRQGRNQIRWACDSAAAPAAPP